MTGPLLLDTCAAIWVLENASLSDDAVRAIDEASDNGQPIYVSPISAWEIGMLMVRGRLKSSHSAARWFRHLLDVPGVRLADMTPEILIASSYLPGNLRRDPADRILAATARELNYVLVTRDTSLLAYASEGHMRAVGC